jgi:hypothetical protein
MRVAENGGLLCLPAPKLINLGSFLSGGTTKKRENNEKLRRNIGDKPRIHRLLVSDYSPSPFALITSYSSLARDDALEPKRTRQGGGLSTFTFCSLLAWFGTRCWVPFIMENKKGSGYQIPRTYAATQSITQGTK